MEHLLGKKQEELNRIFREFDDLYHSVSVNCGLSDSAFDILYCVGEMGEGCRQKDICLYFYTSKQTLHSAIRKLEQDGILELVSGKGRDKHIYLTEKGRSILEDKILPVMRAENAAFSKMSEEESEQLLNLTWKYMSFLKQNLCSKDEEQ